MISLRHAIFGRVGTVVEGSRELCVRHLLLNTESHVVRVRSLL